MRANTLLKLRRVNGGDRNVRGGRAHNVKDAHLGVETSPAEKQHHDDFLHINGPITGIGYFRVGVVVNLHHSSNVYLFPIDKLHLGQIGIKFSKDVIPPFDSGTLCPA